MQTSGHIPEKMLLAWLKFILASLVLFFTFRTSFIYKICLCNHVYLSESLVLFVMKDYSTDGMSDSQSKFLQHLREFGLVFQRKVIHTLGCVCSNSLPVLSSKAHELIMDLYK